MRPLTLSAACLVATLAQAGAQSLPVGETTYIERSLNHSDTLVIEHPPVAANPYGRRNGQAAIAGYCRDGGLIRPVQDCRQGYGAALGLARILRLDEEGYAQRVETRLRPGAAWPGTRLHMLSAAGGFEFIDGSHRARPRLLG